MQDDNNPEAESERKVVELLVEQVCCHVCVHTCPGMPKVQGTTKIRFVEKHKIHLDCVCCAETAVVLLAQKIESCERARLQRRVCMHACMQT